MNVISIPDLTTAARAKTLGLLLFCGTFIASCVDESRDSAVAVPVNNPSNQQPMPDPEFDVPAMLVNLADEVLIPNYAAAVVSTAALADDAGPLAAYCGAIGGADEVKTLDAARDAWREAMADVQAIESHALGPVLDNGEALRNRIHSYANDTIRVVALIRRQSSRAVTASRSRRARLIKEGWVLLNI